jgi:hypothetical protein
MRSSNEESDETAFVMPTSAELRFAFNDQAGEAVVAESVAIYFTWT